MIYSIMQDIDTTSQCKQKGKNKNATHNVAFLINGTDKCFIAPKGETIQREVGALIATETANNVLINTSKENFFQKSSFLYENYSDLDDQEMSLSSKMDFFYSKSESNFGLKSGCFLEDEEQSISNRSSNNGRIHSSISSSREDVSISDSFINVPQDPDKSTSQESSKEIKNLDTGQSKNRLDSEDVIHNSSSLIGGRDNNTSRSSSKLCKRVSVEVSLPSSTQESAQICGNKYMDVTIGTDLDNCYTNSLISSINLSCQSYRNSQSNQEPDYSGQFKYGSCSESDSEGSSWSSSSKNLQDEIDKRIVKGQHSGSLDFSNMKLPFLPSAILSVDVSMINRINLRDNLLISLPGSTLKQLASLTWLDLRFNSLKDIPKEIGHLKFLQVLLLQGNNIEYLPIQLGYLSELKTLKFTDNPLKYPPRHIINGGLEIIKKFLSSAAKRKKRCFQTGSESSNGNSTSKTKQICDSASDISGSKAKEVKTLIEIESPCDEIHPKDPSSCCDSARHNQSVNGSANAEENLIPSSIVSNTDEVAENQAMADDNDFMDSIARTADDANSTIGSTTTGVDLADDTPENSDEESCKCSNPMLTYTNASRRHSERNHSISPSASPSCVNDTKCQKKLECERTPKRLCEKIKEESLKDMRRKSLHLILQNATSDDEKEVSQDGRCLKCRRRIDHLSKNSALHIPEASQVPVTQMLIPDLQELADHSSKPELIKRKKISNLKSSFKLPKSKLVTAKKVEKRIRHDHLQTLKTKDAEAELQEIQQLRSKLGLRSWREEAKQRQVEFAQNFSEYDFIPPFAEAPFAIDEKLLPLRLRPKTPTFSRLNERQRKLSSIESDIKECLRKLGAQEKKFSGESSSEAYRDTLDAHSNVGHKEPKTPKKRNSGPGSSTKETTAVLNQLHCLRRQIQRLKLNAFI